MAKQFFKMFKDCMLISLLGLIVSFMLRTCQNAGTNLAARSHFSFFFQALQISPLVFLHSFSGGHFLKLGDEVQSSVSSPCSIGITASCTAGTPLMHQKSAPLSSSLHHPVQGVRANSVSHTHTRQHTHTHTII